jgi:hypothetical protein
LFTKPARHRGVALLVVAVALFVSSGSQRVLAQSARDATPAPSASSTAKPQAMIRFRQPALFVFSVGKDAATNERVSVAMANELGKALKFPVVPEGDWDLSDYLQQCLRDPSTKGAFIVLPPAAGEKKDDWLVLVRDAVSVEFNAMISECPHPAGPDELTPAPEVAWVAETVTGEYGRSVANFLPFAVLTSVYLAFLPQRTYQTTTTRVLPTPNPIPPGGSNSNIQTINSSVLNASGTSALQNSVVSSVAAATLNLGRQGDVNHLSLHAAEAAAWDFLGLLQSHCYPKAGSPPADGVEFCSWLKVPLVR